MFEKYKRKIIEASKKEIEAEVEKQKAEIYKEATKAAEDVLLQDPVFASAYQTKIEFEKRQRELDTVLNFGMTERVIRSLCDEAINKQVAVHITWPSWTDNNGNKQGGQMMTIQPLDQYEVMKKRVQQAIPF